MAAPAPTTSGLLRLITCGSVDDGKSTLIGRLLHDSKAVLEDQLEAIRRTTAERGGGHGHAGPDGSSGPDLALLTDGLRAEREQGITIDVAYRMFATAKRKFILADTPGHVQYTRNMATGASTADAAIILIDARQGVVEQTRRHACLAVLLGIQSLIVCINKMDLVAFDRAKFDEIRAAFAAFAAATRPDGGATIAERAAATFLPISALHGDNIVDRSSRAPWYTGAPLLELLESLPDRAAVALETARFPVQYIIRPQTPEHHDYRGYAGQLAAGRLRVSDEVLVLPGEHRSRITRIHIGPRDLPEAGAPQSIALTLEHDLDIARGDLIVPASSAPAVAPSVSREIEATVVWMNAHPLTPNRRVLIKHATRTTAATVRAISHRLDLHTLEFQAGTPQLGLNEIGRATFRLTAPIAFDPYARCRSTGAFIAIDEATNNTVGAGMIR